MKLHIGACCCAGLHLNDEKVRVFKLPSLAAAYRDIGCVACIIDTVASTNVQSTFLIFSCSESGAVLARSCPAPKTRCPHMPRPAASGCARSGSTKTRRSATGRRATQAAIEHLGYVQIDTINVIERCHHHIPFTRIPGYRREHLHQAQSIDKTVFEYLAHALAYLPTTDMRFYAAEMREHRKHVTAGLTSVSPKGGAQGSSHQKAWRAFTARYRRRRTGRERPRLGEPQTVGARVAAGVLQRRADRQPAHRHPEDL
jgi:hypothetical protein